MKKYKYLISFYWKITFEDKIAIEVSSKGENVALKNQILEIHLEALIVNYQGLYEDINVGLYKHLF